MKETWINNYYLKVSKNDAIEGELPDLPDIILGDFDCSNLNLTSLKNCTKEIIGNFSCHDNLLTNLKHGPEIIQGSFYCRFNELTSLEYFPKHIKENVDLSNNKLTSLKGIQKIINGKLTISSNKLTSLMHCSEYVDNTFSCQNNLLTSLNYGPKSIGNNLYNLAVKAFGNRHGKFLFTVGNLKELNIEEEFLGKGYKDYYPDLLKYCITNNKDLTKITWPENYLTEEMIKSVKGINKFDL